MTAAYQRATLQWLAGDDVGTSSRTMAFWLAFGILPEHHHHPLDIADLGRCMRLLRAVPRLRGRLSRMSEVSPVWAQLVAEWRRMERLYWKERHTRKCPRTYEIFLACLQRGEMQHAMHRVTRTRPETGATTHVH